MLPLFRLLPAAVILAITARGQSPTAATVVDIVPYSQRYEHGQNAEPNIAVNPYDTTQIVISAFGSGATNPIYISRSGGTDWRGLQWLPAADMSLAWASPTNAYLTLLGNSGLAFNAMRLRNLSTRSRFGLNRASHYGATDTPDQPWTEATFLDGVDHVYIGFNDLSKASTTHKTASIRQTLDGAKTWQNVVIEHGVPGDGADGAAVRVAPNGTTVYAAFQRFNSTNSAGDEVGDIVVVRDDAAGLDDYVDLGPGVVVASNEVLPQDYLGDERLGSDLSIACDPVTPTRVVIAYAAVRNGRTIVVVKLSIDSGAHWAEIFTTANASALPALAIAMNGTIGLLYTYYDSGNDHLETHLARSNDNFVTHTDLTMSRFKSGSLPIDFDPYIGDYEDMVAVGNTFYGAFSASNNTSAFPQQPTFIRDRRLLDQHIVPYSIDPFFFSTPATP